MSCARRAAFTPLHLFGLDHTKLLYFHNAQEDRITDSKPCRVVKEILQDAWSGPGNGSKFPVVP